MLSTSHLWCKSHRNHAFLSCKTFSRLKPGNALRDGDSTSANVELEPPRSADTPAPYFDETPSNPARENALLQATANFLKEEMPRIFTTGEVTRSKYSPNIVFRDPITQYNSLDGYSFNMALLTRVFDTRFQLFSVAVTGPRTIVARWSMEMRFKLLPILPWKPTAVFSGVAIYEVDPVTGLITSHTDKWDSCENNDFLSLEALRYTLQSLAQVRLTPNLETPDYVVLFKASTYEIRKYQPYTVAEVEMEAGSGPAGGGGFTDLAGYIFGGNDKQVSMEMTTPVFSTAGQVGPDANKMQFVMERRFSNDLPSPKSDKIYSKVDGDCIRAAYTFSGFPLDFEVFQAEQTLRAALDRDNIASAPGYLLARYNEPTVPPFLKRNEVLIDLLDYTLPDV